MSSPKTLVVVAGHGRHACLELLARHYGAMAGRGVWLQYCCSDAADLELARRVAARHDNMTVEQTENRPLGRKWRYAVKRARRLAPEHILICGSDDLVSEAYIDHAERVVALGAHDLVAPLSWYVYDGGSDPESYGALFEFAYSGNVAGHTLGAGRLYDRAFLDRVDWEIYDPELDRGLDSLGTRLVPGSRIFKASTADGAVLSIKGPWRTLNPMRRLTLETKTLSYRVLTFSEKRKVFEDLGLIERRLWRELSPSGKAS